MKTSKQLFGISATVLMVASMGSAYAVEGEAAQARIQDRSRVEQNLKTHDNDSAWLQNREEQTLMNKNQNQYKYKNRYMKNAQNKGTVYGEDFDSDRIDRLNTTNRSKQGASITGSMNRQSNATRSMSGNRR